MQTARSGATSDELALHERLLAGDPTAPAEAIERFLGPITRALLGPRERGPDTHLLEDAVIEALFSYVMRPAQYDPRRAGLDAYLRMSASGDLKNARTKEGRRALRSVDLDDPGVAVAVSRVAGNSSVEDEVLERLELELPHGLSREDGLRLIGETFPDPNDRRVLQLMLDGVRETEAYAPVLGLQSVPAAEQQRAVKQVKDRVGQRLKRLRARLERANGTTALAGPSRSETGGERGAKHGSAEGETR